MLNSMKCWTGKNPLAINKADGTISITGAMDGTYYRLSKGVTVQNAHGQTVVPVSSTADKNLTPTNPDGTLATTHSKTQLENLSTLLAGIQ
jgi:hypothetical protein